MVMPKRRNHDPENPELTPTDFEKMRPASELLPEITEEYKRRQGERGPQKAPVKERVTIRLDADLVVPVNGAGRLNDALREQIKGNSKP